MTAKLRVFDTAIPMEWELPWGVANVEYNKRMAAANPNWRNLPANQGLEAMMRQRYMSPQDKRSVSEWLTRSHLQSRTKGSTLTRPQYVRSLIANVLGVEVPKTFKRGRQKNENIPNRRTIRLNAPITELVDSATAIVNHIHRIDGTAEESHAEVMQRVLAKAMPVYIKQMEALRLVKMSTPLEELQA